jgi:Flp pilus assembly protein CpaB
MRQLSQNSKLKTQNSKLIIEECTMKKKTMILMGVAVVCGLAASYLTSRVLANRSDTPPEEEKVTVLIASKKIQTATILREPEKFFVEKQYIKGTEPKKALRKWEDLKDKQLSKTLNEEAFITADDLFDPKNDTFAEAVPPGMRAIAMKVNAASVVAGFVQPKSRVDVIQVIRIGEHSTASTILQNMLILAIDGQSDRAEDAKSKLSSTVTLAARLEDVQKIRLAEAVGELSLVLRRNDDDAVEPGRVTRTSELTRPSSTNNGPSNDDSGPAAPAPIKGLPDVPVATTPPMTTPEIPEAAPAPPRTHTLILENGETVTKAIFVMNQDGPTSTQIEKSGGESRRSKKKTEKAEKDSARESDKPESSSP